MPISSNILFASLSPQDAAIINSIIKPIKLPQKLLLYEAGDRITKVYFPTTAIISLVVGLSTGEMIEAAMVGRDGLLGASSALDGHISLSRAIVQLGGDGFECDVDALKSEAFKSQTLISTLIRHEQTLFAQAQQSTACMASHDVQERLCRWLLRARDLSGSDTLDFTQEFLAEMLGVRRTSVSTVAYTLQAAGMIQYSRGKIKILNVEALHEAACECFDTVNAFYAALVKREVA